MNRAISGRKAPIHPPIVWSDDGYAGLWANTSDTLDDRVSEDLFDAEDERTEVETVVHGTMRA